MTVAVPSSQEHTPKRTRAAVLRDRVVIRLALNETGPQIAEILKENGVDMPGIDWSRVFPHWLIATVDDDVIGCLQVMPAKPFGHLEFLFTRKSAGYKYRAIALRKLGEQGVLTLKVAGCSYVMGYVEPGDAALVDILKKNGMVHISSVALMAKRLK